MKKIVFVYCFLLVLSACIQPDSPPKYRYQTIKPDIIPYTSWLKSKEAAMKKATTEMDYYAKDGCKSVGQGWRITEIKNTGEMECEETSEGHHCRRINVEVECRQIDAT